MVGTAVSGSCPGSGRRRLAGVFALTGDAATGNLFAGGDFTTIGGRAQQRYAKFAPWPRSGLDPPVPRLGDRVDAEGDQPRSDDREQERAVRLAGEPFEC